MEPGREERGDKGRVGRGALADRHVIYRHKFWGLTGRETWAGRPTPQTLNPGWASWELTPGVTPPHPHTYPSQPQTQKTPQVEQRVAQTARLSPAPHERAGHCLARPRPLQAPGQGPRMTHLMPPTLGPWDARGFDQYLSVSIKTPVPSPKILSNSFFF